MLPITAGCSSLSFHLALLHGNVTIVLLLIYCLSNRDITVANRPLPIPCHYYWLKGSRAQAIKIGGKAALFCSELLEKARLIWATQTVRTW